MQRLEVFGMHAEDLPATADYLARYFRRQELAHVSNPHLSDRDSWLRRLQWTLQDNPAQRPNSELGQLVRGSDGNICGVHLNWRQSFRWNNLCLTGLCSGSFYVEERVGMAAFLMFRRFLSQDSCDFHFATTASRDASQLAFKLGAKPVPESDHQGLIIHRYGALLEETLLRRRVPRFAARSARWMGNLAGQLPRGLARSTGAVTLRPTSDWEKLAQWAERYRDPLSMTADRSACYLEWRYAAAPPSTVQKIFEFSDPKKGDGWVSVTCQQRGARRQIRSLLLSDIVAAPDSDLAAVVEAVAKAIPCDIMAIQPRRRFQSLFQDISMRRHLLPNPTCWLRAPVEKVEQLLKSADFSAADGDTGWT